MSKSTTERRQQKARTREAILEGARRLVERGETVTVTDAARAGGVSKATAYRYFSDPHILVAEAGLAIKVHAYEEVVEGCRDVRERIVAISLYFFDHAIAHEAAFRRFLARSLDAWSQADGKMPLRGGRRIDMYQQALARTHLSEKARRQMVLSLTMATGTEAMIALFDIAGAESGEARQAVRETALAICDRFLGPEPTAP